MGIRGKVTKEDRIWAKQVKDRDENKCVICEDTKMLNAHHIIPRENKETRHLLTNGISLCPRHHRFSFQLSAHQNPLMFIVWLENNRPEQLKTLKEICKKLF